eukprot:3241265-Rhodomonas_salina.2
MGGFSSTPALSKSGRENVVIWVKGFRGGFDCDFESPIPVLEDGRSWAASAMPAQLRGKMEDAQYRAALLELTQVCKLVPCDGAGPTRALLLRSALAQPSHRPPDASRHPSETEIAPPPIAAVPSPR